MIGDRRKAISAAEDHLSTYAVVDENPEITRAHIPIDVAIDLVAEGALPYRQEPTSARLDSGLPPGPATTAPGGGTPAPLPLSASPESPAARAGAPAEAVALDGAARGEDGVYEDETGSPADSQIPAGGGEEPETDQEP
jgi:hypothetical protein